MQYTDTVAFIEKLHRNQVEAPDFSAEIAVYEKELGITTDTDRVVEATLAIDAYLIHLAVLDNQKEPWLILGQEHWRDWLKGRCFLKKATDDGVELTVELLVGLAQALGMDIREYTAVGGDHQTAGSPMFLSDEEYKKAREHCTYATWKSRGSIGRGKHKKHIVYVEYPYKKKRNREYILELLGEICQKYVKSTDKDVVTSTAAKLQKSLVEVHPLQDKNGTFSRLVMNWALDQSLYASAVIPRHDQDLFSSDEEWEKIILDGVDTYEFYLMNVHGVNKKETYSEVLDIEDLREFHVAFEQVSKSKKLQFTDAQHMQDLWEYYQVLSEAAELHRDHTIQRCLTSDYQFVQVGEYELDGESEPLYMVDPGTDEYLSAVYTPCVTFAVTKEAFSLEGAKNEHAAHRNAVYSDREVFRGALVPKTEEITDEVLLGMLQHTVGMTAAYYPLKHTGVSATSFKVIPESQVDRAKELYNKLLLIDNANLKWRQEQWERDQKKFEVSSDDEDEQQSVFGKVRAVYDKVFHQGSRNLQVGFTQLLRRAQFYLERNNHSVSAYARLFSGMKVLFRGGYTPLTLEQLDQIHWNNEQDSLFCSASTNIRAGYAYAQGYLGDRPPKVRKSEDSQNKNVEDENQFSFVPKKEKSKYNGVLITARLPKHGYAMHANSDSEVMIPGGLHPDSIDAITIYDTVGTPPQYKVSEEDKAEFEKRRNPKHARLGYPRPMVSPSIELRRWFEDDGAEVVEITSKESTRRYRYVTDEKRYVLEKTEQ